MFTELIIGFVEHWKTKVTYVSRSEEARVESVLYALNFSFNIK